jgi:signal transduction histidine kinase/DNA-binding response OmpR family regulator/ligand-binding sensor domain-containing protein
MKKLVVLSILLVFITSAFCQYTEIYYDRISDKQGLYDHWIKCFLQDSKGFIWIGGENGLYRYDGYNLVTYTDPPGCKNCPHFYPVYGVEEDTRGMLWTITFKGVTLFDPEKERSMVVYRFKSASVSGSSFSPYKNMDLIKDSQGNIWATNDRGLIRFSYKGNWNRNDMTFDKGPNTIFNIDFFQLSQDKNSYQNTVLKIYADAEGNIWAGCADGLYVYRKGDTSFYRVEIEVEKGISSNTYIKDILEQNKDTFLILIGGDGFLMTNVKKALNGSCPDGAALGFTKFVVAKNQTNTKLYKDRRDNIFIGTSQDVFRLKWENEKGSPVFESLYKRIFDRNEHIGSMYVESILEDGSNMMWTAQQANGIMKFNPEGSQFLTYKNLSGSIITNLNIVPIQVDSNGDLWLGAYGNGLYKIQKVTNHITRFDLGVRGNEINGITETSPHILWLGLSNAGVLEFNTGTGKYHDPLPDGKPADELRHMQVNDILKDQNQLYLTSDIGLFVYDISKNRLVQFSYPQNDSILHENNWIISPIKLNNGEKIAVSTHHGILKFNYDAEKGNLSVNCILADSVLRSRNINLTMRCRLYQDSRGVLWLVEKTGLHRIDLEKQEIYNYKLFDNIEAPQAWSIIEDDHENLWIGTHFGLCRFDLKTGQTEVFTKEDGLPVPIHQYNSVSKDKNGRLYFGGFGGFYSFYPENIKLKTYIPPVVITDFRLFNKSVSVDTTKEAILTRNISYTSQVDLRHDQNDISFEFAALDYTLPSRNQYAYKLEGYKDQWIETDAKNRIATYTNLNPGKYIFHVKGSNCNGAWNEKDTSITVIIHKPWRGTTLAWSLYAVVFLASIGGYIRWRTYNLKREKLHLESQVHERTLQIEEQKEKILSQRDILEQQNKQITAHEQLKSRFFANISHEFRTPLSLIQSPVEELLDDLRRTEKERRKLNMVHRNARRLLNLVNQLLDISKIDGSKMKLELIEDDIMKHLRAVAGSFCSLAESKWIHYSMHFPSGATKTWFDPDKLEKIATNLLSNAFRFTPDGGEIIFTAGYKESNDPLIRYRLEFSVRDNGPGIPDDSLGKIFDRFYQVEVSKKKEVGGTGIGLSLSRDMAHLMYGDITVQSKPREGSTFTVIIPLGREHLKESEFILLKEAPETIGFMHEPDEIKDETAPEEKRSPGDLKPVILIVEDNRDIRMQLSDNLNRQYSIEEAIDGLAGLTKATEIIPDLIITDLMMPGMNGIELCEKLKNDERSSHIPVIMLTARAALEDKITGYQTGADDYMPKPFQMAELKVRVANLIEQRRKLRERFSRDVTLQPHEISITPLDEKFMKRAIGIVEKHMNVESFGIPEFREEMFMTRSTLFRKLMALTNQSPGEFIRTLRVKRAASLLKQNFGNVTQVSYEVGFNNLTSFNRSFRKLYGISPAEYKKQFAVSQI